MSSRQVALVVMAIGCAGPSRSPGRTSAPTNQHGAVGHTQQLVHAAEEALRTDSPLDYALPFSERSHARAATTRLFVEACKADDKPSCWKALAIAGAVEQPEIAKLVEANCVGGDLTSCRALAGAGQWRAGLPGSIGISNRCDDHESPSCDRAGLRRECERGFSESCRTLMLMTPAEPDRDALLARYKVVADEGCAAWILSDCMHVDRPHDDPREALADERMCILGHQCIGVSRRLQARGDLARARDAAELTCQYREEGGFCSDLALAYLQGDLPEPVRGRGQALLDWMCAKFATWPRPSAQTFLGRFPECKLASPRR